MIPGTAGGPCLRALGGLHACALNVSRLPKCLWPPVEGAHLPMLFSVAGLLFSLFPWQNMPIRCFLSEVSTPR